MGVVKRQTIAGTLFTYLGVAIGFLSSAIIFPKYLTTEEIGLIGIFLSYSFILAQLATLGTGRITIMMFPYFRKRDQHHHGFFYVMLLVCGAGLILSLAAFFLLQRYLVASSGQASELLVRYIHYIYPLTFFTLVFFVFDSFNTTLFNAVRGIFLREFLQRVLILVFILFFVFRWISFGQFLPLFVIATAIPALLMVASLFRNPEFAVRPFIGDAIREKRKMMASVGVYGILIGFSGMVITNIDRIMVERMMGLGSTGVYTTMAYFATMVIIPSRALLKISDPVLAQSWKDSDLGNVRDNYYRSAISQFLIGSLILIGLWVNIDNILRILPEEFADGKFVILFIGLAFLVDMSSGTATYILANSVYYKYQTYYIMGLVVLIIATNFVLIPVWGLTGAATSTFISKMIINLMRHRLIYSKFGLQPYTLKFLYVVAIAMAAYGTGYLVPAFDSLVVDIGVRSAVTGTVFIALTLIFRISPEFAERLREVYGRVRRRK